MNLNLPHKTYPLYPSAYPCADQGFLLLHKNLETLGQQLPAPNQLNDINIFIKRKITSNYFSLVTVKENKWKTRNNIAGMKIWYIHLAEELSGEEDYGVSDLSQVQHHPLGENDIS